MMNTNADFIQVYREERGARIKESPLSMKDNIIDTKLIPYFGKKCMREISAKDIMLWQNEMLNYRDPKDGKPYSKSYLKTIHNQLSAIFNHAVRYHKLSEMSLHLPNRLFVTCTLLLFFRIKPPKIPKNEIIFLKTGLKFLKTQGKFLKTSKFRRKSAENRRIFLKISSKKAVLEKYYVKKQTQIF